MKQGWNILAAAYVEPMGGLAICGDACWVALLGCVVKMVLSPREFWAQLWSAFAYAVCVLGVVAGEGDHRALVPLHATPNILFLAGGVAAAWYGGRGPAPGDLTVRRCRSTSSGRAGVFPAVERGDFMRLIEFTGVAAFILYLQREYQQIAVRLARGERCLGSAGGRADDRPGDFDQSLQREVRERQS